MKTHWVSNGYVKIGAVKIMNMKKPRLVVKYKGQNVLHDFGSFVDEVAAERFINILADFVNAKDCERGE